MPLSAYHAASLMTMSSKALLARQNGREHDAVVIHARLGAENGDGIARRIARQDFSTARHPAMPLPMTTSFSR
jgi:hypothetical protein